MTLPLIAHRVRGGDDLQESVPQNRLDMTFAEEVGKVTETQTRYLTD